ncbi:glutamate-5-semialdehyde dehydrogenase [Rummeliibacillus sp. TYF005]|uniref:glutamate-5-semialdehyde dehydrogenase n=1 Tax=Rummeliibacillus sp. TYF005 TaxID=2058214 RepID=UPI000F538C42|nr:glutamate-5-semialdehyde dehydrogenase [Rummeliibacillus sp. TYF005]RPJ95309.1 glutamate-5-semialdehyde dehydrogenase [Rummeliibacillus sp. TYF005]
MSEVFEKGQLAKQASFEMNQKSTEEKNQALQVIAKQLQKDQQFIIKENEKDIVFGRGKGLSNSVLDRILLTEDRIKGMIDGIQLVVGLADPVGEVLEEIEKENGLHIEKRRVPLGVIGMIYEARPNVTIDAATLALKTGNAVILRGSSSAIHSNRALIASIHKALSKSNLPINAVQLIENTSHEAAEELFRLKQYIDVLIPRGGKNLIDLVVSRATVPVLETGAGNCHIFIDETADLQMVKDIVINAKTQRPSVCNAAESLLIHKNWFAQNGEELIDTLLNAEITIYGDETIQQVNRSIKQATESDWGTEYLALALSAKIVQNVDEAINHINKYGTKHSEAIITENNDNAGKFQTAVDAAAVYHNASTRFTDGFEFGYGAEIGISTQKLHARGPMGLPALTSSKYFISGNGQIRN